MLSLNTVRVSIYINGEYFDDVTLGAPPFIGAGISIQENTPDGFIVMRKLRVTDVILFSMLNGSFPVYVYCTERE